MALSRSIVIWLWVCAALVFAMANVGAITRLTESGLSITYWEPVKGAVPPLSDADWTREFTRYQSSPQYQKVNQAMSLPEFKHIFWWEWLHRQLGRTIGLVYAAGLIWFWARRQLTVDFKIRLLAVLVLGGLQGFVGWFMVQSGLINDPAVSHYRLAAHLLLAAALYSGLIFLALLANDVRHGRVGTYKMEWLPGEAAARAAKFQRLQPLCRHGFAMLAILVLTITWGAFVAGLRAGLLYNTWPLMGDSYVPPDMWHLQPVWLNIFENHSVVQFVHRNLAYLTAAMGLALAVQGIKKAPTFTIKKLSATIGCVVLLQASLGILTILTHVQLHIAVTHQAGAFTLLGLLVCWLYFMRRQLAATAPR